MSRFGIGQIVSGMMFGGPYGVPYGGSYEYPQATYLPPYPPGTIWGPHHHRGMPMFGPYGGSPLIPEHRFGSPMAFERMALGALFRMLGEANMMPPRGHQRYGGRYARPYERYPHNRYRNYLPEVSVAPDDEEGNDGRRGRRYRNPERWASLGPPAVEGDRDYDKKEVADLIVETSMRKGMNKTATIAALAAAMVESNLGADHRAGDGGSSVGVFQTHFGWGRHKGEGNDYAEARGISIEQAAEELRRPEVNVDWALNYFVRHQNLGDPAVIALRAQGPSDPYYADKIYRNLAQAARYYNQYLASRQEREQTPTRPTLTKPTVTTSLDMEWT
jgi:hypothetical protein